MGFDRCTRIFSSVPTASPCQYDVRLYDVPLTALRHASRSNRSVAAISASVNAVPNKHQILLGDDFHLLTDVLFRHRIPP